MKTTTLKRIKSHSPCEDGWKKLLKHLGKTKADDEPLPFATIVESNGLDDALWCCRVEPQYDRDWRLFAVWCARQGQHLLKDQRSIDAIDVAERYAYGKATDAELATAEAAAEDAARAATWAAARDTAKVAAWAATWNAARAATWAAAWDAAFAATFAATFAADAAEDAARDAESAAQTKKFLQIVTEET